MHNACSERRKCCRKFAVAIRIPIWYSNNLIVSLSYLELIETFFLSVFPFKVNFDVNRPKIFQFGFKLIYCLFKFKKREGNLRKTDAYENETSNEEVAFYIIDFFIHHHQDLSLCDCTVNYKTHCISCERIVK